MAAKTQFVMCDVTRKWSILKERVAGYNNVLTLATKNMKFGVNKDINYFEPSEDPTTQETSIIPKIDETTQGVPKSEPRGNDTPGVSTTTVFPRTNDETVYSIPTR